MYIYINIYTYSIDFQCWGTALRCIYLSPRRPAENQKDRHKTTKGLQIDKKAGGLTYYASTQVI